MEQVSATRSELLARRARIGLATQGRDLLKERRSALVREFHRLGASALESIDVLDRDAADAGRHPRNRGRGRRARAGCLRRRSPPRATSS